MKRNKKTQNKKSIRKKKQNTYSDMSRSIRKLFQQKPTEKLSKKQIYTFLGISSKTEQQQIDSILKTLEERKFLLPVHSWGYTLNTEGEFIEGILSLNNRGVGFVTNGAMRDIYISAQNIGHALGGDRVRVQIIDRYKTRIIGQVVEVIERLQQQFVGVLQIQNKMAFFIPDNYRVGVDFFIPQEDLQGAKNGEKVLVKMTGWPKSKKSPYGKVIQRLGEQNPNDIEMLAILASQGIDFVFDAPVLEQAQKITMDMDPQEIKKRRDMRSRLTFTIDPEDAKDFDDALSFCRLEEENLLEIGVHIADVSHYVPLDSPLDKEALKRSNSVYLVDRVIPMLPEEISNFACSLRPNEDKYSFSVVFKMDEKGTIKDVWYGKTVIHSNRRFTYQQAQEIIEGKDDVLANEILMLHKIAQVYRKKRLKNGALNIETEEIRFVLDENKNPIQVQVKKSEDANKLVEEFMLLANRYVAELIGKPVKNRPVIPFIYRVHDQPDAEKIELLSVFIDKFGYELSSTDPKHISKAINTLFEDSRYSNEHEIIQTMVIRSMAKAVYQTDNIGHYGLAFPYYTHFTSPIRRYADLMVHRILHDELTQKKHRYTDQLDSISKHISRNERLAIDAERESSRYFQTVFVADKIGQEFDGIISGIAEQGVYVRMTANQCEGMVAIHTMTDDTYAFDAQAFKLIGYTYGKEYNFGDTVRVRITEVSTKKRQINLEFIDK